MIAYAVLAGLIAALCELAYGIVQSRVLGHFIFAGPSRYWLTPAGYIVVFSLGGAILALVHRIVPALRRWLLALATGAAAFSIAFLFHPGLHLAAAAILSAGVAWRVSAVADRHYATSARRRTALAWGGTAIVALVAGIMTLAPVARQGASPSDASLRGASTGAPNVVLLILDTVRGSELSLLGYHRHTSPRLEAIAAGGVTFEAAMSPAPWTLPAHASILTGRPPHALLADWEVRLEEDPATLPEVLGSAGYRTAGFVGNVAYASEETGIARGFGHYEDYVPQWSDLITATSPGRFFSNNARMRALLDHHDVVGRRTASELNAAALKWIERGGARGAPFFVMINYYDAHEPYLPHAPFDTLFGRTDGRHVTSIRQINSRMAERVGKTEMDGAQRDFERLAYDQSIAELDAGVGAFVDSLGRRGLLENTVLVVTSDHGEQFGERGLYSHGNSLFSPSLHVPLVLVAKGRVGGGIRRRHVVSTQDIGATVLALAGVSGGELFPGTSLLDSSAAPLAVSSIRPARNQSPEYPSFHGALYSVTGDSLQLIRSPQGDEWLEWRSGTVVTPPRSDTPAVRTMLEMVERARGEDRVRAPSRSVPERRRASP